LDAYPLSRTSVDATQLTDDITDWTMVSDESDYNHGIILIKQQNALPYH